MHGFRLMLPDTTSVAPCYTSTQADSFTNFRALGLGQVHLPANQEPPCGCSCQVSQSDCSILKVVTVEGSSLIRIKERIICKKLFQLNNLNSGQVILGVHRETIALFPELKQPDNTPLLSQGLCEVLSFGLTLVCFLQLLLLSNDASWGSSLYRV